MAAPSYGGPSPCGTYYVVSDGVKGGEGNKVRVERKSRGSSIQMPRGGWDLERGCLLPTGCGSVERAVRSPQGEKSFEFSTKNARF